MTEAIAAFVAELRAKESSAAARGESAPARRPTSSRPGASGGVAWVRRENFHLTLKFLGEIESARITPLTAELKRAAAGLAPFTANARGAGAFPSLNRPRTLWVALESADSNAELIALAAKVEEAAIRCGFAREPRPFSPHLTIGRVRQAGGARTLRPALEAAAARGFGGSRIQAITLYQSHLSAEGARYEALRTIPLRGAEGSADAV